MEQGEEAVVQVGPAPAAYSGSRRDERGVALLQSIHVFVDYSIKELFKGVASRAHECRQGLNL